MNVKISFDITCDDKLVRSKICTLWNENLHKMMLMIYHYHHIYIHTYTYVPEKVIKYGPSTLSYFIIHSLTKIRKGWRKFAFFANYDFLYDAGTIEVIHSSFQKKKEKLEGILSWYISTNARLPYIIYTLKVCYYWKRKVICIYTTYKQKYLEPCKFVSVHCIRSFDCIILHKLLQLQLWTEYLATR